MATADVRAGGSFRLEMITADGHVHAVTGTYAEVDPPNRLLFTWQWDGDDQESLVQVDLLETSGRTTVRINHTLLATEAEAERHAEGWTGCLTSLAAL